MNKVAYFSDKDRAELFRETASKMHTTSAIAEKDFWVVWTLEKIFTHPRLSKILMFKGGTSLSKIYGLIERFSEDIDLILNWDLLTKENPEDKRSKNKQDRFNKSLNLKAGEYIGDELFPIVEDLLAPLCTCKISDGDKLKIEIHYPALFTDSALLPAVLLEIGPLAHWFPTSEFEISSFAAQKFPHLFETSKCKVNAVLAERTFWEKATILHQEAHRSEDKKMPLRYSRHYYDMAMMANSNIKARALGDLDLLQSVIGFNQKFYPCAWAKFQEAVPGTLKLIPPEFRMKELLADYKAMRSMIFGEYLEFEKVIKILDRLEKEINCKRNN